MLQREGLEDLSYRVYGPTEGCDVAVEEEEEEEGEEEWLQFPKWLQCPQ